MKSNASKGTDKKMRIRRISRHAFGPAEEVGVGAFGECGLESGEHVAKVPLRVGGTHRPLVILFEQGRSRTRPLGVRGNLRGGGRDKGEGQGGGTRGREGEEKHKILSVLKR